jgi:hypothetical protein
MHRFLSAASAVVLALALGSPAAMALNRVPYPEVKVEVSDAYKPDAAFNAMRKAFSDAVAKKDSAALFALVGPTFVWTMQGSTVDQLDMGRDSLHNFKVVFGFRQQGKDTDGGVENGPYWDALAAFAARGHRPARRQGRQGGAAGARRLPAVAGGQAAGHADPPGGADAQRQVGLDPGLGGASADDRASVLRQDAERRVEDRRLRPARGVITPPP